MRRDGREAVLALFQEPERLADAIDQLRAAGFTDRDFEILTDAPYPGGAFGEKPEQHRLHLFPLVGAGIGLAIGLLYTIGTQISYPLVTGGKPILSIPPMVNVTFETTMLLAVIFTVAGVLFESRLPDFDSTPYDPRISEGYLGLLVKRTGDRLGQAEQAVRAAGAVDVVTNRRA